MMMKMMKQLSYILLALVLITTQVKASDSLTLDQAISLARHKSLMAITSKRNFAQAKWAFKEFRAQLKPELLLSGALPNYTQSYQEVIQPDGQINFKPIRNTNAIVSARINQQIAVTGTQLFLQSNLQRYDDLVNNLIQYNGLPVRIGIQQSLSGYNKLKWEKRLASITLSESGRSYSSEMEKVSLETSLYFFQVLIAQTNLDIANSNLKNNERLYQIAQERLSLGKISKEDELQLKLEWVNAQKAKFEAEQQLTTAGAQLRSFLSLGDIRQPLYVTLPKPIQITNKITYNKALEEALANRPELKTFDKLYTQVKQELARSKAENRFQADINASIGLAKSANTPELVYENPNEEQNLSLTFAIPIIDWGKRRSAVKIAKLQEEFMHTYIQNQTQQIQSEIMQVVSNYNKMLQTIQLIAEAQEIALARFNISTERLLMGHISATEYTISLRAKDDTQRTYALAIRDFWTAHFQLRLSTLFDFEHQDKIMYQIN